MNLTRRLLDGAQSVAGRAWTEAHYAGTLIKAAGAQSALVPPHRYVSVLRALEAYGPPGASLALGVAAHGKRTAIIDELGSITYAELDATSNALAHALRERGFRAGDGLGILARNHRGFYQALFAGAKLGAVTVLLNTDFSGPQLADVCRREGVTALIHDDEFAGAVGSADVPQGHVSSFAAEGADRTDNPTIDELIADAPTTTPSRPERKQRLVLLTSGTSGTPKGAPRDLGVSLAVPGSYLSKIPLRAERTVLVAAPVFHAWGVASSVLALGLGDTLVLQRRFDPATVLDTLASHQCDTLLTVPILLSRLVALGADEIKSRDLEHLRIIAVSGSALSTDLARRTTELFGEVVYNLYGSTEVAYAAIATPEDLREAPGTVGRPPYGTVVKIFDEDDRELPTGQTGRIFVGSTIQFEGYTGGGTKDAIDGLMSTGDLGHLDEDGRLFIEGRDDDMIVSGGENVFPAEIEDLLSAHEGITEAAVVGVDDPDYGQRLRAYVVRADGAELDADAVRAHVKANLARYKAPRDVVFVDALPRNPAGKVVRRDLPDPDEDD
jgi:fatty-acyl-CoA synthase